MTILVQTRSFSQKMKTIFVPTALALFLSACTGSSFFKNEVTDSLAKEAYATSEFYINKSDQTSDFETKQSYRLLAVRKLLDENKVGEAQDNMAEVNVAKLNDVQRLEYNLLNAQLSAAKNDNAGAAALLKVLPQAKLSQAQSLRFYQTYARIAENQKDVIEIVRARALMDNYLIDNKARQESNDIIWGTLRNANRGMLEKAGVNPGEVGLAGWLALINAYNASMSNPSQLPQVIENWKQQYPSHSAANVMPTELQNVANFQQTQLNGVGLLLPLSGDAKILGDIIKRGFDDAKGADSLPVTVYDTDAASMEDILAKTQSQGVQTLIGPLLKSRVDSLLANPNLANMNVNVLALNATPNARALGKVCYYGLSPEAEAKSAADRFYRDGIANAIVAAPNGDFGQRSAEAFEQRWRQLTSQDVNVRFYNDPFEIVSVLQNNGVAQSSGLYALGTAEQLLQLKQAIDNSPLANQFPIYTSSRSNSPNNGAEFRLTMEGVKFSEIPLLADVNSDEYKKADALAGSDFSMMRLYAMGSDAWLIANKFNEFRQIPGYKVSGLTGVLSAGTNCNIERDMTWLQYRGGSIINAN